MYEKNANISIEVMKAFRTADYTLEMLNFPNIYRKIKSILPSDNISFCEFNCEMLIGCEMICAAICHNINWDVLRQSIYEYTKANTNWLEPSSLKRTTSTRVEMLFKTYDKSRIKAEERSQIIREIGTYLVDHEYTFSDIFFTRGELKEYEEIVKILQEIKPFSYDFMQKKMRLLIHSLTDYKEFENLQSFFQPTIDYHLIRLFMRRGIVKPINQIGRDFVAIDKNRKEQTMSALRKVCADAVLDLCWITNMNVKEINRIEWWIGRSICVKGQPDCFFLKEESKWLRVEFEGCPYIDSCQARNGDIELLMLNEPNYKGTSY